MKHFIRYIIVSLLWIAIAGCRDEFIEDETIGKGEARISATLDFKPMASALTRAAGSALKDINCLHVLLYDAQGNLLKTWEQQALKNYAESDENRTGADAENGRPAEAQTKHVTFSLPEKIDFGWYYMYAVANIPDLLEQGKYDISTVDALNSLPLTWNSDDVTANGQMLGCFTNQTSAQSADESFELNTTDVKLHAWLRRAASKVTIAYDGSQLKEGVFVYLQSVQIKDIPYQCYLGKDNNVGAENVYTLEVMPKDSTSMLDGEIITYHEGDKPEDFEYGEDCADHRITVGSPHFGSHGETTDALYFYENMQGVREDCDKRQDANGDGKLDYPGLPGDETYRPKDNVPYGTYIEVRAHYISNNSERLGNGEIIYRFMLGQNVIDDYNAKRNCHYKLTLKFKNFANEADWHIEYKEPEPGVMVPEPYYISYLYNHSMMLPVKVGTGGHKIEWMKAEIVDNRWAPHNADQSVYYTPMDKPEENEWNGFLSLHETTETRIGDDQTPASIAANKKYYEQTPKRGVRVYSDFNIGEHPCNCTDGKETDIYRVEKHLTEEHTYNVYLPMYTRAKQLISTTGYTGNNPYVAYQRKAVVRITTKLDGIDGVFENEVPIYQVRRIVNPKGIYRSWNNTKPFHVKLMRLPGEDAENFVTFQSEGEWKAYIVKEENNGDDGISLEAGVGSILQNDRVYGQVVYGKTGSEIDFNVTFKEGDENRNRYAIIRVEYHNYTCQHLIFVRQGNVPDNLIENGALWYAENMTTKDLASSPLDEGSLFRRGNWDYPIDALNNKNNPDKSPWINVTADDFKLYPADGFTIAGTGEKKKWGEIEVKNAGTGDGSLGFETPKSDMRVATFKDYNELKMNEDIEQGYGVLYGDDAIECAVHIDDAYGYDYKNNEAGKGMRGCFVYNKESGRSLFFPIGASGYGHRKDINPQAWGDKEKEAGILRYNTNRTKNLVDDNRPLFYDSFKRPGAIYWLEEQSGKNSGWDINYFTFDFNSVEFGALGQNKDACFIRCVKKE